MTTLTRDDIGRLLTVRNEAGALLIGTLLEFNERGDAFMAIAAVNLDKRWERLDKLEVWTVIDAVEVKDDTR